MMLNKYIIRQTSIVFFFLFSTVLSFIALSLLFSQNNEISINLFNLYQAKTFSFADSHLSNTFFQGLFYGALALIGLFFDNKSIIKNRFFRIACVILIMIIALLSYSVVIANTFVFNSGIIALLIGAIISIFIAKTFARLLDKFVKRLSAYLSTIEADNDGFNLTIQNNNPKKPTYYIKYNEIEKLELMDYRESRVYYQNIDKETRAKEIAVEELNNLTEKRPDVIITSKKLYSYYLFLQGPKLTYLLPVHFDQDYNSLIKNFNRVHPESKSKTDFTPTDRQKNYATFKLVTLIILLIVFLILGPKLKQLANEANQLNQRENSTNQ